MFTKNGFLCVQDPAVNVICSQQVSTWLGFIFTWISMKQQVMEILEQSN